MEDEQIEFLRAHIQEINRPNFNFQGNVRAVELFSSITNMKSFLKTNFIVRLNNQDFYDQLIADFQNENFIKSRIINIADANLIAKSDLESFFSSVLQRSLTQSINKNAYISNSLNFIQASVEDESKFRFTKNALKKILEKQFDFIFSNGFPSNLLNINSGVMTANAGDSAQFLFLARAILAGYNCSNVDVRSSRYDAVIDFNNVLLRIQIKGVSSGNTISFKDRDRGGQGIDHQHERNRGQRITSAHCDIYVSVDKEVGICYLIPMTYIDTLEDNQITAVSLATLSEYKENWEIIAEVAATRTI